MMNFIKWYKAMKRGPKYHLGDVVKTKFHMNTDLPAAILAIRFVGRDQYKENINQYKYLLNNVWYREDSITEVIPFESEDINL